MTAEQILWRLRHTWLSLFIENKCTDLDYYTALGDLSWLATHHDLPDLVKTLEADYEEHFE